MTFEEWSMAHPRMYDESSPTLKRLREICLGLPGAFEKEAWGECTFRVTGGSMFAMTDNHHHGSDHVAVWVKATTIVQEILVNADAERFFVPPYVGAKGWVGVRIDYRVDWDELRGILEDAYSMSVPKRLRTRLPAAMGEATAVSRIKKARVAAPTSRTKRQPPAKPALGKKPRSKRGTRA
jgi:hypothetical protein